MDLTLADTFTMSVRKAHAYMLEAQEHEHTYLLFTVILVCIYIYMYGLTYDIQYISIERSNMYA